MRLSIVANRLHFSFKRDEGGEVRLEKSPGGLVSGVGTYLDKLQESFPTGKDYLWIGWPGITIEEGERENIERMVAKEHAHPVFLTSEQEKNFYQGFCNDTIWPFFHYFPSYVTYDKNYWLDYKRVNEIFCDAIMEVARPDDVIWVQDYHLMLLPKMLRERLPDASIDFFLHVPFPSFEIFRLLPGKWRNAILNGLLGADLIGFHTHENIQYFLGDLRDLKHSQEELSAKLLSAYAKGQMIKDFKKSKRKLILLDYDGTLVPIQNDPHRAVPPPELISLLRVLISDSTARIAILTGRDRATMDRWFGEVGVYQVAEHGVWLKRSNEWGLIKPLRNDWKEKVLPILMLNVDKLPGSFVEEKEYSISWHYRGADPELASLRVKELTDNLLNLTANMELQIQRGQKVIEIRNAGADKGAAALQLMSEEDYDFVMAIGDDWTDEDMFQALPESVYTIKVGVNHSRARFNVHSQPEVIDLLRDMVVG